jgi:hypothetical protein
LTDTSAGEEAQIRRNVKSERRIMIFQYSAREERLREKVGDRRWRESILGRLLERAKRSQVLQKDGELAERNMGREVSPDCLGLCGGRRGGVGDRGGG